MAVLRGRDRDRIEETVSLDGFLEGRRAVWRRRPGEKRAREAIVGDMEDMWERAVSMLVLLEMGIESMLQLVSKPYTYKHGEMVMPFPNCMIGTAARQQT